MNDAPCTVVLRSRREQAPCLLDLRGVTKKLEKSDSIFQLDIERLQVACGEFVAIVGESGCGKSTLLDLLGLISAPTAAAHYQLHFAAAQQFDIAALWAQGADETLAQIRHRFLGYILQTGGLLPYLSVAQNLLLPMKIKKMQGHRADWLAMAQRMGVESCLSRLPSTLSGGQRQRVAILRALLHNPKLILADEPTAAVDKRRAHTIVHDLQRLAQERGVAILMVTHDINLVQRVCDKAYSFNMREVDCKQTHSSLFQI